MMAKLKQSGYEIIDDAQVLIWHYIEEDGVGTLTVKLHYDSNDLLKYVEFSISYSLARYNKDEIINTLADAQNMVLKRLNIIENKQ